MQTFRKLPKAKPARAQKMAGIIGRRWQESSLVRNARLGSESIRLRKAILSLMGYSQRMAPERDSVTEPAALFAEAVSIMHRLRAPGGCPWDREQTFDSIQSYTLEETYEVFDAIDRQDWRDLSDELGDLLLQVLFYSEMAAEVGHFSIADVVSGLNRKLVRRHPHVFGDEAAAAAGNGISTDLPTSGIDSTQVLRNWEAIKRAEKADRPTTESRLDSVQRSLPALVEARKLGSRARKSGFDWPDTEGLFSKLQEETAELREALESEARHQQPRNHGPQHDSAADAQPPAAVISEIGDLLFTAVNLARHLNVDPEFALRHTNAKFRRRFAQMETSAPAPLEELSSGQLEQLWNQAKMAEAASSKASS
jgi:XTP/dITP diphosphohydrolase/ATP diphosphatase